MTATTGITGLGLIAPQKTAKSLVKKLDVAIAIKRFLENGEAGVIKCGKLFDYAFGEMVQLANRLKTEKGRKISMAFDEKKNVLTVITKGEVFVLAK